MGVNTCKTKEMIVDYRRKKAELRLLYVGGHCVERVAAFQFLGATIEEDVTWSANTFALVKKAQ